jgi:hypothetical protein
MRKMFYTAKDVMELHFILVACVQFFAASSIVADNCLQPPAILPSNL